MPRAWPPCCWNTGPAGSHVGLCYSLHEGYMRFGAFGIKQNLLDGFGVYAGSEKCQHHGSHMAFGCQRAALEDVDECSRE